MKFTLKNTLTVAINNNHRALLDFSNLQNYGTTMNSTKQKNIYIIITVEQSLHNISQNV